jgi:plastocyanin
VQTRMRGTIAVLVVLPLLALAACGQGAAAPNEVSMTGSDFSPTNVTITAGQAVHFTDPPGVGAMHIVCLGADGKCDPAAQGPQELKLAGFTINVGDPPRDVTFTTPGTYQINCTLHPSMNLTVTVR